MIKLVVYLSVALSLISCSPSNQNKVQSEEIIESATGIYVSSVSPASNPEGSFGAVASGNTITKIFTIKTRGRTGSATASLQKGASSPFQLITSACTLSPNPGCTIRVRFSGAGKPNGTFDDNLILDDLTVPLSAELNVTPPAPNPNNVVFEEGGSAKTVVDFGVVTTGSVNKIIYVKDTSKTTTQVQAVTLTGGYTSTTTSCTATQLNSTAGCSVRVVFSGSGKPAGVNAGQLTVLAKSVDLTVNVQSTPPAGTPDIKAYNSTDVEITAPVSLGSGSISGVSVSSFIIKYKNLGAGPAYSSLTNSSTDFYITGNSCGGVLNGPSGVCQAQVNFSSAGKAIKNYTTNIAYGGKIVVVNANLITDNCAPGTTSQGGQCVQQSQNCAPGFHFEGGSCVANTRQCTDLPNHITAGNQEWSDVTDSWGSCFATACEAGYDLNSTAGTCNPPAARACTPAELSAVSSYATAGDAIPNGSGGFNCQLTQCQSTHHVYNNNCQSNSRACTLAEAQAVDPEATGGNATYLGPVENYACSVNSCIATHHLTAGACDPNRRDPCATMPNNATAGYQDWNSTSMMYGSCVVTACSPGFNVNGSQSACVGAPTPLPGGIHVVMSDMSNNSAPLALFSDGRVLAYRYEPVSQNNYLATWSNASATNVALVGSLDIAPSNMTNFTNNYNQINNPMEYVNNKVYFVGNIDGLGSSALYEFDPNNSSLGFKKLKSFNGAETCKFKPKGVNDRYIFCANNVYVLKTDEAISATNPSNIYSSLGNIKYLLTMTSGLVYFGVQDASINNRYFLLKSDGTLSGTEKIGSNGELNFAFLGSNSLPEMSQAREFNGVMFFAGDSTSNTSDSRLWRTDGTLAGTYSLADINPGANDSVSFLTVAHGNLYFTAVGSGIGQELYRYTGAGSLSLINDIRSGTNSGSAIYNMNNFKGNVFFEANDGAFANYELWRISSAGDSGGRWWDVGGGGSGAPRNHYIAGNYLYFAANPEGTPDRRLYRTNGSSQESLTDISTTSGGGSYDFAGFDILGAFGDSVILSLQNAANGKEFFKYSGSSLTALGNLSTGADSSNLYGFTQDGTNGYGIISTTDGAKMYRINSSSHNALAKVPIFTNNASSSFEVGSYKIYTQVDVGAKITRIMSYDGVGSPVQLTSIATSSAPIYGYVKNNILYFTNTGSSIGLWKTDGTPSGTVAIRSDITVDLGYVSSVYGEQPVFVEMNNKIFFIAVLKSGGTQGIWKYDPATNVASEVGGTAQGVSARPAHMTVFKNKLYFLVGTSIYRTGGDTFNTEAFDSQNTSGQTSPGYGFLKGTSTHLVALYSYYVYDAGLAKNVYTKTLYQFTETPGSKINPLGGTTQISPSNTRADFYVLSRVYNDKVYFTFNTSSEDKEMFVYTPSTNDLSILDICSGSCSSNPTKLTVHANKLFFTASESADKISTMYIDASGSAVNLDAQFPNYRLNGTFKILGTSIFMGGFDLSSGKEVLLRYSE